jgi:hypothetical protein
MSRTTRTIIPILDGVSANGVGASADVREYRHIVFQVSTTASATATIKFQCSLSNVAPDFSAAQSTDNHWDYLGVYDLQDASAGDQPVPGATGVEFSSVSVVDSCRNFLANADYLAWVNVEVSGYSAGDITVNAIAAN